MKHSILPGILACLLMTGALSAQSPAAPERNEELDAAVQLVKDGRLDDALKKIEEAVKKNPKLSPPKVILAKLIQRAAPQQAKLYLEQAVTESPDHPDGYLTLGEWALNEGRATEAIFDSAKAMELPNVSNDQKKTARQILAGAYEQRHDWNSAKLQLAALLELDPKNGPARQRYATALFNLNQTDEALREYQSAFKNDPGLLHPFIQIAMQYMDRHDNGRAQQYFEKAVAADPNGVRTHLAFVEFLLLKGDVEGAKLHADMAARLDANSTEVRQAQGVIARMTRDYGSAEQLFHGLMIAAPNNWVASNQLALVLAESPDSTNRKRGLDIAEANNKQFPRNVEVTTTLAYCLYRNGNPQQARQVLSTALPAMRNPRSDLAYIIAVIAFDDPANAEDAIRLLKGALNGTGVFFYRPQAQELLARLEKNKSK